jgi:hypothetical protein
LRRIAALALLLAGALAAHAQTPPDSASPPPSQAAPESTAPTEAPAPAAEVPQPPPGAATPEQAEPAAPAPAPHPPPARAPQPRAQAAPPQAASPAPAAEHERLVSELRQEVSRLQSELDAERAASALQSADEAAVSQHRPWGWLALTALFALGAGFVLGWRLLDRRIRRKYGGLRIY